MSDDLKNFDTRVALYVESHRLLEWVDQESIPPGGWLVVLLTGGANKGKVADIMAMPAEAENVSESLQEGEFWAPTLREALRKAKG